MAEEKKTPEKKPQEKKPKQDKQSQEKEKKPVRMEERFESLIRIHGFDVPGSKNIFVGLTYIKGISWSIAKAICVKLGIDRSRKVQELSKDEVKKIEDFLENLSIPDFLKNRRFDPETGKTSHIYGSDLDIAKEFDIKRLKQMKSYAGIRHAAGQPVRGQRTKSHFRKKKTAIVGKRAAKPAAAPKQAVKK